MKPNKPVHSALLTEAARATLRPMGIVQKGRSRTWLDDHGWWLCVVEFQPSSWSRGSYLNVGCMWLWRVQDYLSFDEGYRVEGFAEFHDADQFRPIALDLSEKAAAEAKRYRSMFQTVQMVSDHYLSLKPDGFWKSFNAAIACGLAGRASAARQFFKTVLMSGDDRDWVLNAQDEAARLEKAVDDVKMFKQIIEGKVAQTRQLLKLRQWTDDFFK